ncbi:MAG: flagellar hook-associated protein 3 FlgL [Clostridia bacterium]|nr:flagellar hook-associated protein 3 FlgL [Clostridia bacterium]
MRVTNKMLTQTVMSNINTNLSRLDKLQNQLSSGKRVTKPSDDPIAVARIMSFKTVMKSQEQYDKNMQDAMGWLDTSDGALDNANKVLQRVRELAVYGSNDTLPDESRKALAQEVDKLVEEMVQIGNTNYGGRYIFGGGHTTEPPFEVVKGSDGKIESVKFIGYQDFVTPNPPADPGFTEDALKNTYKLEFEVESGVTMNVAAGSMTFHTGINGSYDLNAVFEKMIELRKNLENGDTAEINSRIGDMDKLIDNVLSERAVVGAKSKRMETAQERSFSYQMDLNKLLGRLEDVDFAEATMDFHVQQTVYQAALATGAQIIQPTLIDFLK